MLNGARQQMAYRYLGENAEFTSGLCREGPAVLRALLIGPLRFTPIDDGSRRGYVGAPLRK